jgi:ribosome maturation factor RimP
MSTRQSEVRDIIQPLCESDNIILSDILIQGGGKNTLVKVVVDTEDGITLNQCQGLSKKISDIFYRKDMFSGLYQLEVTSPGINKPLRESYEFKRNIGKQVKVKYHKNGEHFSASGELVAYTQFQISLKSGKDLIEIPLSDIEQAKIKLKW